MPGPGMDIIGEEEKRALMEVIESGYLYRYGNQSDPKFKAKVWNLEQEFAKYTGTKYALAVNSGTSALLTALWALGIGPGDEVIVPGYTFIASITSIVFARAIPILAEVDKTLTLDPEDVKKKITPRTKAIMLVHMLGNPGHIDELKKIAEENDLYLIEDCAQAMGAFYKGKSIGTYGVIGTFSLNVYKTITAGDGGILITNDEDLYKRAFAIHDQGHLPLRQGVEQGKRTVLGLNFRMNELTAAVAKAQLDKLEYIRQKLHKNKSQLKKILSKVNEIEFRTILDEKGDVGTLLTFFMPDKESARKLVDKIGCTTISKSGWHVYSNMEHLLGKMTVTSEGCPFTCPYYEGGEINYFKGMLPQTDDLLERAINISVGVSDPGLGSAFGITINSSSEDISRVGKNLINAIKESL
ncbi:MAG: aminotransferase class I/II-fold pyridoxal phosphate-dependent enzyme [Candidatus Lokiarchaeota archaeon]|nr:aminotransferase class I/II-fold pyridoxal phosphate-dependent enzyme [Candidatus Lokiarchaeota archaeon]MBD3338524.1 aminotransferase class I/II-fold pyridoxal phosphate-dependent enzyme [Candidatus Lokiarchaeota archaeon]